MNKGEVNLMGFPGGSMGAKKIKTKHTPANAGYMGLIPGLGRSPGGGNGNQSQYSCLGNSINRGAWWATVHGVAKSWTELCGLSTHAYLL